MSLKKPVFFFCFLLFAIYSSAQVEKETTSPVKTVSKEEIGKLPFSKGINNFIIQQNFGYSRTKPENSDNHRQSIDLNLDYNRFIIDGFALGVELDLSSVRSESTLDVLKNTEVMFYGNAIYGHSFGGNINLYGKASVGFGQRKFSYTNYPSAESDLFGYKFEIGSPIHLYNDGGNYITPFIRYDHIQQKDNGIESTVNEFSLGFQFQNYSPCSGYQCDRDRIFSGNMYSQGRSFIGYSSMGEIGFGKSEFGINTESDISSGSFNFQYGYYITRDVALGAGLNWTHLTEDDGTKNKNTLLSFMPMITLNAPSKDWLENLFLQAGYGFGFYKIEASSTELKYNISNLSIGLGFNHFFGRHLAFTPRFGYSSETFKNPDVNVKDKHSGFEFGFGCSLHW